MEHLFHQTSVDEMIQQFVTDFGKS